MSSRYTADDYLSALRALTPPGPVWAVALGSVQEQVLKGVALALEETDTAAVDLLADSFPATSDGLLPEWEETTGLPDPCAGVSPTLQQRQAQVVARLANSGGQSAAYYVAYAALLGFKVSVTDYSAFRVGSARAGQAITGANWAHAWAINAPLVNVTPFRAGHSGAGEPLQAFGNTVLECEMNAIKPAHTDLIFLYS